MKRDTLIICFVILLCSLAISLHNSSLMQSLPEAIVKAQDEITAQKERQVSQYSTAALLANMEREKIQKANQEREAFTTALARIPTDVPEPQRSEAARHLIEIEKQDKLKDPMSFESMMARAMRK